ncbi:MAG: hypothetical protein DMF77_10500, partial [Acidobacteria bacterium]
RGDYPGSAYQPRLDAMIEVSRTASAGGPLAAMGGPLQFRGVERIQGDLGVPIVADLLGRARGRPIALRTLGTLNLAFLAAALFGLVAVLPAPYHAGLIPVFLLVPLYSQAYVSADIPTIHGALSLVALLLALLAARSVPPWAAALVGLAIFVLQRFRAVYGLYCIATMLAVSAWTFWRRRERRLLIAPAVALATVIALGVAWNVGIGRRAQDERFADKDALGTHNAFEPLVSGVGWTPNEWGIEPWDPRVGQFLADRLGLAPVGIYTRESERRARVVYASLWREAPGHLVRLYLARVPGAFRDQFVMGRLGVGLWDRLLPGDRGRGHHGPLPGGTVGGDRSASALRLSPEGALGLEPQRVVDLHLLDGDAGGQRLFLPELVLIHGLRRLTVKARASAQRARMAQLTGLEVGTLGVGGGRE